MKESQRVYKLMRDVERTVRERPQNSVETLSSLLLAGEALVLAQIYLFCDRFDTLISISLITVLLIVTVSMENFLERWLTEIAELYNVDATKYRMKFVFWPVWLGISLVMLLRMGFSLIYFVIGLGAPLLAIVGVLIYAANYCCRRFAGSDR